MSIFNKLQKALGFSYDDEPAEVSAMQHNTAQSAHNTAHTNPTLLPQKEATDEEDQAVNINMIFNGVVNFINSQLPPYIKENLNEEGQMSFIYEKLDDDVRNYLKKLEQWEKKKFETHRIKELEAIMKSYEELKEKCQQAESQLVKENEKTLSAERQKRALHGRITDMEQKVAGLMAEREQLELENKSLLNKLRVADVTAKMNNHGGTEPSEDYQDKIKELEEQIKKLTEGNESLKRESSDKTTAIESLQSRAAQITDQLTKSEEENKRIKEQQAAFDSLRQELETLKKEYSALVDERDSLTREIKTMQHSITPAIETEPDTKLSATTSETISFDDADEVSPVSQNNMTDNKLADKTKSRGKKRKSADNEAKSKETDKFLDDTDWLTVASNDYPNPDLIVAPSNEDNKKQNDQPSQMSLW